MNALLKATMTAVDNLRYRISTMLAAVVVITGLFTCIYYIPQPWAVDMLKLIVLGAVGVILVNKDVSATNGK